MKQGNWMRWIYRKKQLRTFYIFPQNAEKPFKNLQKLQESLTEF